MAIINISSNVSLGELTSVNDGDTVLFKTSTVFDAALLTSNLIVKEDITVGYYGTGEKPMFSGGVTRLGNTFTQDAPNGVWYVSLGHSKGGCVSEDGVMMQFTNWLSNPDTPTALANTLASMVEGSFMIDAKTDNLNHKLYIKTAGNNPVGKTYIVAETKYAFLCTSAPRSNLRVENLAFEYLSVGPLAMGKITNSFVDGVDCYKMGANYLTTGGDGTVYYYGGGISYEHSSYNGIVQNCLAEDCFDSSFSPQTFVQDAEIDGMLFKNNISRRCGMSAMEVAIAVNLDNQKIKNVHVDGLLAEDTGINNWSGNRGGDVIKMLIAYPTWNKSITACVFENIQVKNAVSIVKTGYLKGTNRFINIYGDNVTNLVVEDGVANTIKNQYYNFTDNLGRNLSAFTTWDSTPGLAIPTRTILSK